MNGNFIDDLFSNSSLPHHWYDYRVNVAISMTPEKFLQKVMRD